MTEKAPAVEQAPRRRRLSREILGIAAASFAIALVLQQILGAGASAIADGVISERGLSLASSEVARLDALVLSASVLVAAAFFTVLFLFLVGERLAYIRDIERGIEALREGRDDHEVPVEGSNELTDLAEAVNFLAESQRRIRAQERRLAEEREQLIRALSHDIRTPLTSILAYSELLEGQSGSTDDQREQQCKQAALIRAKAEQIKALTDVLLDGAKRSSERFDDAHLLMAQLAAEFEGELEDRFDVSTDLSKCPAFPGTFDAQELRRIFDNLASNVAKYADAAHPVTLSISLEGEGLAIRQGNCVRPRVEGESAPGHGIGLVSIRRIAQSYAGRVNIEHDGERFEITVVLSDF